MKKELLISVDIEADGDIPGEYSMTSIGATPAVIRFADGTFKKLNVKEDGFYADLKPISDKWIPEALAVGGLPREHFVEKGQEPSEVMKNFVDWIKFVSDKYKAPPRFTAYPASYDWLWVYWYLIKFYGKSPFGFSGVLDMKTLASVKGNRIISQSSKKTLPKHLLSKLPHTHNALDDAREQGVFLQNLLEWDGKS